MPLNNDALLSQLETIVNQRNSILKSSASDEDKLSSLSVLDKENDELNQSIDIYYRLVDYQGFVQYQELLASKADISQLPDLTPYAKKTDLPVLAPYAKKTDLPVLTPYAKKTDLTSYAKKTDLPVLTPYAKKTDLTPYAKKTDLPVLTPYAKRTDLTPYAKKTDLPVLTPYVKKVDLPDTLLRYQSPALYNGWVNKGDGFSSFTCYRIDRVVYISGFIIGGNTARGSLIAQLPSSFSPSHHRVFPVASNGSLALVDIFPDGTIKPSLNVSSSWLNFEISFIAV